MKYRVLCVSVFALLYSITAFASDSLSGTYKTVLLHENEDGVSVFYQYAETTLRSVNTGDGNIKISASVRIYYGDENSNEFLTYDYPEVPLNILTRQISLKSDNSDVSFVGFIKNGGISGDWFSTTLGRVGSFNATKKQFPALPQDGDLVKPISALYLGVIDNSNPNSNLPDKMTVTLVTTQDVSGTEITLKISGNLRFYLGAFGSLEYVETPLEDVKLNFYTRYITIRTKEHGITIKGVLDIDGTLNADVFADGFGKVGTTELVIQQ